MARTLVANFGIQLSRNYIDGYTMITGPIDVNNFVSASAGTAMDSTNTVQITINSTFSKNLNAPWAPGHLQGGLDTGSKAGSTTYHAYVIHNPTTGLNDMIFSVNGVTPTLPSGYTYYRRIGCFVTNGSLNIIQFLQVGDNFFYSPGFSTTIGVSTTPNNFVVFGIPANAPVIAMIVPTIEAFVNGSSTSCNIGSPLTNIAVPSTFGMSTTGTAIHQAVCGGGGQSGDFGAAMHSTNSTVFVATSNGQVRAQTSNTSANVRLYIQGWIDRRGKL